MRTNPIVFRLNNREKDLLTTLAKEQGKSLSQTIRDLLELSLQDSALFREIERLKDILSREPEAQCLTNELATRLVPLEQGLLRANLAIDELTRMICRTEETYHDYQRSVAAKFHHLKNHHKEF